MAVYRACVLSTLLYGSESWTRYARQEKRLNTFHMRNLRRILGVKWFDYTTNNDILELAHMPSMYTLLRQSRLRWLGHVCRMTDGRIPKDLLYGELAAGKRAQGRPQLRFKDVCKKDLKAVEVDMKGWESLTQNRSQWRQEMTRGLRRGEENLRAASEDKRARRKDSQNKPVPTSISLFRCHHCNRDCLSRIGLYSHTRRCSRTGTNR